MVGNHVSAAKQPCVVLSLNDSSIDLLASYPSSEI